MHVHRAPHKPDFDILTLISIATHHKETPTQPNSEAGVNAARLTAFARCANYSTASRQSGNTGCPLGDIR